MTKFFHSLLFLLFILLIFVLCSHQTPSPDPQANDILPPDKIADETRETALSLPEDENSDILRDGSFDFGMLLPLKLSISLNGYDLSGQDVETTPDITDYLTDTPPRAIVILSKIPTEKEVLPQKRKGRVIQRKSSRFNSKRFRSSDSPAVTEKGRYIPAGPVAYIGRTLESGTLEADVSIPSDDADYELAIIADGFWPRVVQIQNLAQYVTIARGMGLLCNEDSTAADLADRDGDLVPDIYDAFPDNATYAFSSTIPFEPDRFLTIAYEDNFPNVGDADYNDFIARYAVTILKNADNQVVELKGGVEAIARAAGYDHRFGIRVKFKEQSAQVKLESFNHKGDAIVSQGGINSTLAPSGPIAVTGAVNIDIWNNTKQAFTRLNGGSGIDNGYYDQPRSYGHRAKFSIVFDSPVSEDAISTVPYDPYLYVHNTGYDVHLIGHRPLPGSNNPHYTRDWNFRDPNGFPRALLIPFDWAYPREQVHIETAYTQFIDWRTSNGQNESDWYIRIVDPLNYAEENVLMQADGAQIITPGAGGVITQEEKFTITFPAGAVTDTTVYLVNAAQSLSEIPFVPSPENCPELDSEDEPDYSTWPEECRPQNLPINPIDPGYIVTPSGNFNQPVQVCINMDTAHLEDMDMEARDLSVVVNNESENKWEPKQTSFNATTGQICATTEHFSPISFTVYRIDDTDTGTLADIFLDYKDECAEINPPKIQTDVCIRKDNGTIDRSISPYIMMSVGKIHFPIPNPACREISKGEIDNPYYVNNIDGNINNVLANEWNNASEDKTICGAVSGQRLINEFVKPKDQGGMGLRKVNWYTDGGQWVSVPGPPPFEFIEHPEYRCNENTTTGLCFNRWADKLDRSEELFWMLNVDGNTGFQWNKGDFETVKWRPQGITSNTYATYSGTKKYLVVSWYVTEYWKVRYPYAKGVRLTFIDVTDMDNIKYAHLYLVGPLTEDIQINKKYIPIKDNAKSARQFRQYLGGKFEYIPAHAGGIEWYQNYIYVPDTGNGFRVFDVRDIMVGADIPDDKGYVGYFSGSKKVYARGYSYILPQKFYYKNLNTKLRILMDSSSGDDYAGNFSFVSQGIDNMTIFGNTLDWHYLLTGEYYENGSSAGNLHKYYLWGSGLLVTNPMEFSESDSISLQHGATRIQGAFKHGSNVFLNQSGYKPNNECQYFWDIDDGLNQVFTSARFLVYDASNPVSTIFKTPYTWPHGLEDMHYVTGSDNLWTLTEFESDYDKRNTDEDVICSPKVDPRDYGYENGRYVFSVKLEDYE